MKILDKNEIRETILLKLPEGKVIPRHTEKEHFYEIKEFVGSENKGPIYPSVTGKLQILKDPSLINYKMNRSLDYVFAHFKEFTDANIMEQMDIASKVSGGILEDAGDIGTRIHDLREKIFKEWIKIGVRPNDFVSFIPKGEEDVRTISALRALEKFCIERDYIPLVSELYVYSHKFKVAGSLDDIGLIKKVLVESLDKDCLHDSNIMEHGGKMTCLRCGLQYKYELCLLDVKTSNQLKDHYFFQVALYGWMFKELTGLKPSRQFILKLSKEDGTYKIEDLKKPSALARYSKHMLKTNEGIEFIKTLRKDNQKVVAPVMQL